MKSYRMLLVLVAVVCMVQTARPQCLTTQDDRNKNPGSLQDLEQGRLDFSLKLLKTISNSQPSDNIFLSPFSIFNAMLLAYFTSGGRTEKSLKEALFLPRDQNKLDLLVTYRLLRHLVNNGDYKSQVNSANRLFIHLNQTVKDCMSTVFEEEIQKMDLSANGLSDSVRRINDWIAEQTNNNIQDLISADSINPGSQLILVNAAYFKGVWKTQFDPLRTVMGKFFMKSNKSVLVPMMTQLEVFSHCRSEELKAEVLEMPYKGGEISMIVLLPDPSNSTHLAADLLNRLTSSRLKHIINELKDSKNMEDVEVAIPKFTVERTLELTPILELMGVGDLFKSTSNLTGLTGGPRIQFNGAVHKAKIQVDEKGTVAAAATAIIDTRISSGGTGFICDRPFVYVIFDKQRMSLLFAGVYNDPSKKALIL